MTPFFCECLVFDPKKLTDFVRIDIVICVKIDATALKFKRSYDCRRKADVSVVQTVSNRLFILISSLCDVCHRITLCANNHTTDKVVVHVVAWMLTSIRKHFSPAKRNQSSSKCH
jgi:hypothetical protein